MFWIELIIVLAIIFIGVRVGGTFLAMAGGIGMFIMTFILHVTPSDPPITVILIMIAVICAAATMQACGGLDYLVRIAEKILRKNPKMITVLAPVVAYIFTFMCGTGQIWVYDFSKRLEQESNDEIIPYLDYAFFSYDRDDEYIRNFMVKTNEKGAKTVVAMLGEYGSLAYENGKFYKLDAEKVEVVNTVGAGDSYIAAFTYGVSLGEDIMQCMRRGRQRATEIIQQFNPYK